MKKSVLSKSVALGVGICLFSLSALAAVGTAGALTCESSWETNENKAPHCHVVITDKTSGTISKMCGDGIPFADISTEEGCEHLCESKDGHTGEKLAAFLYVTTRSLAEKGAEMESTLQALAIELKITSKIAGAQCVRAEKLEYMMNKLMKSKKGGALLKLFGGAGSDDEDSEGGSSKDPSEKATPPGMYS